MFWNAMCLDVMHYVSGLPVTEFTSAAKAPSSVAKRERDRGVP
jgi:hypothetical protein